MITQPSPIAILVRPSAAPPIVAQTLAGVASHRDATANTTMATVEEVTVGPWGVTHRIGALGAAGDAIVVRADHPAVIDYLEQVIAARKAHEYRLVSKGRDA